MGGLLLLGPLGRDLFGRLGIRDGVMWSLGRRSLRLFARRRAHQEYKSTSHEGQKKDCGPCHVGSASDQLLEKEGTQ
jgi:hypothetical protein